MLTIIYADMAELADAQDLESCGYPCRFNSCYPHQNKGGAKASPLFWYECCKITGVDGGGASGSERFALQEIILRISYAN